MIDSYISDIIASLPNGAPECEASLNEQLAAAQTIAMILGLNDAMDSLRYGNNIFSATHEPDLIPAHFRNLPKPEQAQYSTLSQIRNLSAVMREIGFMRAFHYLSDLVPDDRA